MKYEAWEGKMMLSSLNIKRKLCEFQESVEDLKEAIRCHGGALHRKEKVFGNNRRVTDKHVIH